MTVTRSERARFIDGFVICFLAAACAATIALNIGLSVSPGKILPTTISMRTGDMSENIIAGLKVAENDVAAIRNGLGAAETWSLISERNLDLFFFIALILPMGLAKSILTIGYFLKFGLAASMMYAFCNRHVGLRRLYSFLLGMMYAFSSQIIMTAQFSQVMNMAILIPCALSAFDSYLRERTWKYFSLSSLVCALIAASGNCGFLSGVPFLAGSALVLSVGLYSKKRKIFSCWLKLLGAVITGTAMAAFSVIPRYIVQTPRFDVVQAFKSAEMRYKFFDMLRHTFVAQSGGIDNDMPPVFYIGILTIEALVLFWANFRIPTRVKVTAAFILSVWYISCSSSFVSEAVSIFGESTILSSSRLICLEAFLFIYAAISLKNIGGIKPAALYAAFLIPLAFLVFSGNNYSDIQFSTTINLGTAVVMIVCGLVIRYLALNPAGKKFKVFIAVLGASAVTVNAAFIMFNNTVSVSDSGVSMFADAGDGEEADFYDDAEGFSVFSKEHRYLLLSGDVSNYRPVWFIDGINYMSNMARAGDCFQDYEISLVYNDQAELKQNDVFRVGSGFSSITFELTCLEGDRMFVYNGFNGDITIRNNYNDFEEEIDVSGPRICELESAAGRHEIAFFFDLDEASDNRLVIMKGLQPALGNLEKATGSFENNEFTFRNEDIPGNQNGRLSFITSLPYDGSVRISVNGRNCRTFEYLGLTGCIFEASGNTSEYNVRISKTVPGLAGGITVSAAVCLALIAIPLVYKYTNINKKKGKRSEDIDLLEQPE
ncbi:MAG: YfhO family protein [Saccharofermentans sp.]|nr:YfhO family protein [Saccharofermentans sp.]